jgi:hypothetical protein
LQKLGLEGKKIQLSLQCVHTWGNGNRLYTSDNKLNKKENMKLLTCRCHGWMYGGLKPYWHLFIGWMYGGLKTLSASFHWMDVWWTNKTYPHLFIGWMYGGLKTLSASFHWMDVWWIKTLSASFHWMNVWWTNKTLSASFHFCFLFST